jgi:hypothetical protein
MGLLDMLFGGDGQPQQNNLPMDELRQLGLSDGLINYYQQEQAKAQKAQMWNNAINGVANIASGAQGMGPRFGGGGDGGGGSSGPGANTPLGLDGLVDRAMKFSQLRSQIQSQQNLAALRRAISEDPNLTPQQRQVFTANPALYDDVIKSQVTDKGPAEVQIYNRVAAELKNAGQPVPSLNQWLPEYRRSGQQNITVNTGKTLAEGLASNFIDSVPKAQSAASDISAIHTARDALEGGIFTGQAADIQKGVAKIGSVLGIEDSRLGNTEAFMQAQAGRVFDIVKGLGTGAGITDADREFAREAAGGNIKFEEGTIRRLLDIQERANRAKITIHNSRANSILEKNPDLAKTGLAETLLIPEPPAYKTLQQRAQEELDRRRSAAAQGGAR